MIERLPYIRYPEVDVGVPQPSSAGRAGAFNRQ